MLSPSDLNEHDPTMVNAEIISGCRGLRLAATRGELGIKIAQLVLRHSPADILQMKRNFETKVQDLSPDYRDRLTAKINEHLLGTFHRIRLAEQQGLFRTLHQPVTEDQKRYWDMVAVQCLDSATSDTMAGRFLKYLLAGYSMLVAGEPGHPVGTPFPGGDEVEFHAGEWYCPVREKSGDVDAALCPFCPAIQTPEVGYLRPATRPTERKKQELIDNCYTYHNFNG